MFFDADTSEFDKEGKHQILKGHVVAIAAGTLVSADRLSMDNDGKTLLASGHVIVLSKTQVLTGDSLIYDLSNKQFTLSNALMLSNDPKAIEEVTRHILGFSKSEMEFEASRASRLKEITGQKQELQQLYRAAISRGENPPPETEQRYIVLLEKERAIRSQLSKAFAGKTKEKRESLKRRRAYWRESQALTAGENPALQQVGYFSIEGDIIRQISDNKFEAKKIFMTPCMCEAGDTPPWGFRAASVVAEGGGYADLEHPVLEIKGIPVLYLPWLRLPVKSKRQTGFLLPGISHSKVNGNMFSQPVYFAFNDHTDATLTTDHIEKRGLRLGLEYRVQTREYSGWEFHLEGIRDKLWLQQAAKRKRLAARYDAGLVAASEIYQGSQASPANPESDPDFWQGDPDSKTSLEFCLKPENREQCRKHEIANHLRLPENTWRGQFDWKGMTVIAPRLSLVSHGLLVSDHRYQGDLWVPSMPEIGGGGEPIRLYAPSRIQLHLDGSDFYAGIGSHFSDPFRAQQRFSGYQIPADFKLQSRTFSLLKNLSPLPIYLQLSGEQKRIEVFKESEFRSTLPENTLFQRLGNGNWRRLTAKISSPLVSERIVSADYFTDFEHRSIESGKIHQTGHRLSPGAEASLPETSLGRSSLNTMRTGIHFSLPLDGSWELPSFLRSSRHEDEEDYSALKKTRKLMHRMVWDVTLAYRPQVRRNGSYGETSEYLKYEQQANQNAPQWNKSVNSKYLTYFPSDQELEESQEIIFSTYHSWQTFDEVWRMTPGSILPKEVNGSEKAAPRTLREQAQEELYFSLDQSVPGHEKMFSPSGTWYANRYSLLQENHFSPLTLTSAIRYDHRKQLARREKKEELAASEKKERLPEPWSPLETTVALNWAGWSMNTSNSWNIYSKNFPIMNFSLHPPDFYKSSVGFTYTIENQEELDTDTGDIFTVPIKTMSASIGTGLIPHISTGYTYAVRVQPDQEMARSASMNATYTSDTGCWGLGFAWSKPFEEKEWSKGTYYLSLAVKFLGHQRNFGNIAARYNQDH